MREVWEEESKEERKKRVGSGVYSATLLGVDTPAYTFIRPTDSDSVQVYFHASGWVFAQQ